jgi:predicted RNA polymerase sigma factor
VGPRAGDARRVLALVEDAAQEAFVIAAVPWPRDGEPTAWCWLGECGLLAAADVLVSNLSMLSPTAAFGYSPTVISTRSG